MRGSLNLRETARLGARRRTTRVRPVRADDAARKSTIMELAPASVLEAAGAERAKGLRQLGKVPGARKTVVAGAAQQRKDIRAFARMTGQF